MTKITLAANCRRLPVGDEVIIDVGRDRVRRWNLSVRLPPTQMRLLMAFAACPGRLLVARDLIEAVWFDDPHGGPDAFASVISVMLHRCRYALAPLGLVFATNHGWRKSLVFVDRPATEDDVADLLLKSMRRKKAA